LAWLAVTASLLAGGLAGPLMADTAGSGYGIAMHGAPALPPDFRSMPYANPDAPKGGRLIEGLPGTFDSLNPLIVRGSRCNKSVDMSSKA
jgi:peptide/nickel transport system substrate-binding protein